MSYIGNQAYTVIETHVGSIEGTATAAVIQAKAKVDGQMWVASDTGDLWLSDGFVWMNVGRIKGDKGDTGQRGTSITGVAKTAAAGSVDTYTITYTDATTSTFEVSNANTWFTASGVPSDADGANGDLYLDTQTSTYYKKIAGVWSLQGTIKGDSFSFDARGTLAERAAHNTEAAGFGYLSYAETPPKVYYKMSATSGDWSAGTAVGKGEKGTSVTGMAFTSTTDISGLAGISGATDTYTTTFDDGSTSTYNVQNGANGAVMSVAGRTGNVVLAKADVGLNNVNNTADANKPISTSTQTALNLKQDTLVSGTNIKTVGGVSILGSGDVVVGGATDYQEFTTSGTWTKPNGVTWVYVEAIGGGAGACTTIGGGGGGFNSIISLASILSATVTVTIGAGGTGTSTANTTTTGGDSTFGGYLTAHGGYGGNLSSPFTLGMGGGGEAMSTTNTNGGSSGGFSSGAGGYSNTVRAGNCIKGGAGGAGFNGSVYSPAGISTDGGNGGSNGANGSFPGGGGSAKATTGANGANGRVRIWAW